MKKTARELFLIASVILPAGMAIIPVAAQPVTQHVVDNSLVAESGNAVVGSALADESSFASERDYNIRFASPGANNQIVAALFKTLDVCLGANTAPTMLVTLSHSSQRASSRFGLRSITDGFGGARCQPKTANPVQSTRGGDNTV